MPKKKKTRKQKIISDSRHIDYAKLIPPPQVNPPIPVQSKPADSDLIGADKLQSVIKPQQSAAHTITTSHYSYLYSDLHKTFALTFSIIIAEIVIGFFFFGAQ